MALIRKFERKNRERNSLHDEISATYSVFEKDGRVLLQIDMYGRETREKPGKQSQTIQLDRCGAEELLRILKREFKIDP
ncbi:MAG: methionyl-tRNA formyltransferase [Hyphomicrobiaceae bacterium]